jgi:hypothetical protein
MNAGREFGSEQLIYHAMALQPGLSFEGIRHNMNPEVCLSARPVPGMALMLVRFVQNLEALRRESLGQLLCDEIGSPHGARLGEGRLRVNGRVTQSSLEGVTGKSA